jgi:L-cysteine S-thiosulfotransferase
MRYCLFTRSLSVCAALVVSGVAARQCAADERPQVPRSGLTFQSQATQQLQADDDQNPAMLWVQDGADVFAHAPLPQAKSCAACHGENASDLSGVATRYPAVDQATGQLLNIEARINACRTRHQSAIPFAYESKELIGLTAFLTHKSRGLPRSVAIDGAAAPYFEQGRAFFTTRQGQLNLSCAQCHDGSVGSKLRGDTISQGQTHGWPAYRLEWQTAGSLHRRLRACSLGVRAEILDYGAPEYVALELYLAWRGGTLPIEAPGVRR